MCPPWHAGIGLWPVPNRRLLGSTVLQARLETVLRIPQNHSFAIKFAPQCICLTSEGCAGHGERKRYKASVNTLTLLSYLLKIVTANAYTAPTVCKSPIQILPIHRVPSTAPPSGCSYYPPVTSEKGAQGNSILNLGSQSELVEKL